MITKEGSTKIVNSMTSGARVLLLGHGHIVKMQYFFFCLFFSTLGHGSNKLSNNDKGRVNQNCKFHDLRGKGSCVWTWPHSENAIFLFLRLLYMGHGSNKLSIDDKGRVYQNCKFHYPWGESFYAKMWP